MKKNLAGVQQRVYTPPKVMRLDDTIHGCGKKDTCDTGSSADAYCEGHGSSATVACNGHGSGATVTCHGHGSGAVVPGCKQGSGV
jgi:hypothetical protein